jgi:hypothetical protein
MPMKLNVGLSRKVTDNNYGSQGASVNVELEVDSTLVNEPAKLHEKIRQLFTHVRSSLTEELNGKGHGPNSDKENGQSHPSSPTNGNGTQNGIPRPATQSQAKAIFAIAKNQGIDLGRFLQERFQVNRPEDLSIKQASAAIDELKGNTNGRRAA